ncbi:NFACT family protein [Synechococcus sp. CC9616]|jgi:predicted ribosome quality control (RQC) complex YloA/Tae2 family protein|uniref:Rqc2 family fibronectin-binding protein n=1 Tax=Synechococcus sp. CC9616 TaxID=110663 RepID=UPI00048EF8E6|nr:NFACT RNA binding domain-containing protein [Synechococcus sp. CC9616]RPF79070.1 MAG: DUF814 domain-containing protein [Synechococcus sp. TMED20]
MTSATLQMMDLTTLRAVLSDLRPSLLPGRFEKAQQPDPLTLQLGFRTLQGMVWLELSWQADAPRLVQIRPPARLGSGSTLAQQLQHSLRQMALVGIEQGGFERVVDFQFSARPGESIQRSLVLELMGRHSNVMLLDDQRRVVTIGRQVRDHQSRIRPIGTGDAYVPPPPLQGLPPHNEESLDGWRRRLTLVPVSLKTALQQCYQGISPPLVEQLAGPLGREPVQEISTDQWQQLHQRWTSWLRCLRDNAFALQIEPNNRYRVWGQPDDQQPLNQQPLNQQPVDHPNLALALGAWYRERLEQKSLIQRRKDVEQRLTRWSRKERTALEEQQSRLAGTADSAALQEKADALLCLQAPSRDQVQEAQKLYQRARKLRRSVAVLNERIQHHEQRLQLIEASEVFIDDLATSHWEDLPPRLLALEDLCNELDDLLNPRSRRQDARKKQSAVPQPLELTGPGGLLLQVGRNHRQNDWISLRQARSGDLWFHAQECPGSHVVLKASSGLPEEADLQLASDLAAHFSRARGNRRVPVVMVPTDRLQRIPGAAPGTVRHRGGTIRWGEPGRAEERLSARKLLA